MSKAPLKYLGYGELEQEGRVGVKSREIQDKKELFFFIEKKIKIWKKTN